MINNVTNIKGFKNDSNPMDNLTESLSKYTERTINDDRSVNYKEIETTYFLENNTWSIDFFRRIEQFKDEIKNYKHAAKNISFTFNNHNINKEIKFIVYNKLFSDEWRLSCTLTTQTARIRRLSEFINDRYPNINSMLDLNLDKTNLEWITWLDSKGFKLIKIDKVLGYDEYKNKSPIVNLLENMYESLFKLTDSREEWEKDTWDVRNLAKYGVNYNKSITNYYANFNKIENIKIRNEVKKYIKQRLIANHKFSFETARVYTRYLPNFINLICQLEPTWNDLKGLERYHIEKYLQWLKIYVKEKLIQKNSNFPKYIYEALGCVQKFLSDIQIKEYDIAPIKDIRMLIFPTDKPNIKKKPYDQIDYVPDYVLDQLFNNINKLHKKVIPIIYIMFNTGLRISDVLGLKQDCLTKLNNKYWIVTDIEKTYVKGHRIPIDDKLANMLAVLIDKAKLKSNKDNNPENLIFVTYKGKRKGKPYDQGWLRGRLNKLAIDCNICDELGNIFHFKHHAFRHTYAIKLLNGGADILTVQELLAHASPEMTIRYARLLDDTKRKVFDNVIKQGVFSFDEKSKLKEENNGEIPSDVLDMLWTNHKLNAIDTPYGTCLQRTNGKCQFAKQPPCLTCNGESPCRDLCIGAFEGDIRKYEILINSTKSLVESAKIYNRIDMIKENEELLKIYEDILVKISEGNIIYSRLDRLKKKG